LFGMMKIVFVNWNVFSERINIVFINGHLFSERIKL
jgi:hypothetical protein